MLNLLVLALLLIGLAAVWRYHVWLSRRPVRSEIGEAFTALQAQLEHDAHPRRQGLPQLPPLPETIETIDIDFEEIK